MSERGYHSYQIIPFWVNGDITYQSIPLTQFTTLPEMCSMFHALEGTWSHNERLFYNVHEISSAVDWRVFEEHIRCHQLTHKYSDSAFSKSTWKSQRATGTQFHEAVLARTVLNGDNFVWMAKRVTFCDLCFHYTLDQTLVKR